MKIVIKNNKKKFDFSLILSILIVITYIIGGNALTFDLNNRMPIKVAEVLSIPLILINFKRISFEKYEIRIIGWLLLGFVSTVIGALVFSYDFDEIIYGTLYIVRIVHLLVLTNIIYFIFQQNDYNIIKYIKILYLIVCFIGFWQLMYYPVAFEYYSIFQEIGVDFKNPDPHIGRLLSTYFDPNFLAACLIIPYTIVITEWNKNGGMTNIVYLGIYTLTIILTVSRSGIIGILIVSFISCFNFNFSLSKIKRVFFISCIGVITLILNFSVSTRVLERLVNSSSDGSTWARFQSWYLGLEIWNKSPLIGIGYNMIGVFSNKMMGSSFLNSTGYGNDSSLLVILITTGLIGIIYLIWFILKEFIELKIYILDEKAKAYLACLFSFMVICNFNNLLFYTLWLFPILLLRKAFCK